MERLCWRLCWFLSLWCMVVAVDVEATRQQKLDELLRILGNYSKPPRHRDPTETKNLPIVESTTAQMETAAVTTTTTNPEVPDFPGPLPDQDSSYREFYRVFYGTEEGLKHLKKNYGPNGLKRARARYTNVNRGLEDMRRANEHVLRIRTRARCGAPTPVLVRVKDYYPDPSREYFPRCTLLHKCGEASGCCENDAYQCVPKTIQEVALHFYTIVVREHGLGNHVGSNVPSTARLLFDNHTACQCQPINDWPRIAGNQQRRSGPLDGTAPAGPAAPVSAGQTKCRECPMPFTSRVYRDGSCGCDCFYKQRPCLKIKRGKRPLAEVERSCIEANFCHFPDCEYGVYNRTSGYCPRRPDRNFRRDRDHAEHRKWEFSRE